MAKKRNKITTSQATHTSNQSNLNIRSTVMQSFNSPQIGGRANGGDINWTLDLEEELMISERVEAQDLKDYRNVMTNRLQEFREEFNELKHLRI